MKEDSNPKKVEPKPKTRPAKAVKDKRTNLEKMDEEDLATLLD